MQLSSVQSARVTMVKKRLATGEPCGKCVQAEALLRERGAWGRIDQVVWAIENEPESEGMLLARRHGIDSAPFFLVDDGRGQPVAYGSVLRLLHERLQPEPRAQRAFSIEPGDVSGLQAELAPRPPQEIVRFALQRFGAQCALAFSGAEDVAVIDMAAKSGEPFSVFVLDTGRLHPETYRFIERVRKHYTLELEVVHPEPVPLSSFVRKKGLFSFYEDGHKECCEIRKVEPLRRTLQRYGAWMTGQRRDQSPTRTEVPVLQLDPTFVGKNGTLVKLNPLASWSSTQTWSYLREHGVPHNELHDRGFASIGCEPCTRPTNPGQHEREGRWWWEDATRRECGLHSAPPPPPRRPER